MKFGILAGASALALFPAISAAAQSNSGTITQSGTDQQATINQIETNSSEAEVIQSNASSAASVAQRGDLNRAKVTQSAAAAGASAGVTQNSIDPSDPVSNDAEVAQTGASQTTVRQNGTGNTATVTQSGADSFADVDQTRSYLSGDSRNEVIVSQGADDASIGLSQHGGGLKATVIQGATADGASAVTQQVERNHELLVQQTGTSATAFVGQSGDTDAGNVAAVIQYGNGTDATVVQSGGQNNAEVLQTNGAGRAELEQTGASNRAFATQTVAADADIAQLGDGNIASTVQFGNAGNSSATIDQIGAGNQAYTAQYGNAGSTANVAMAGNSSFASLTQAGGGGHVATVRQGGNSQYNSANIYQGVSLTSGSDPASTGNQATVTQNGEFNLATVTQLGTLNEAFVTQNGNNATATISQSGTNGTATISQ